MRRGSDNEGGQRGQATIEWIGLVLGVALVLATVAAGGREATNGESAAGLGDAVAERITCAARDACGAGSSVRGDAPRRGALRAPRAPRGGARGGSLRAPGGVRPSAPREAPPVAMSDGSPALRGVGGVAKRAWIVCLGYRRWRYDVEHPRTPRQAVPVRDTLKIVNECVNPFSFFFG
ncbi:MAG: hypothetical protein QOD71_1873 [Thermoleophilaceae bacterium]|jgi:hypothetical protein|nr:hypothetical protein [Thermoleophilaceae bacterium]